MRGRLVGEDQRGIEAERAGDRDALLLAARQVSGMMVRALGQPDLVEQLGRTGSCLLRGDAGGDHR